MVKREYLKDWHLIALILLCILPNNSCASAWLPEPGHYKYTTTFGIIDKMSQNKRNNRSQEFVEIQNNISRLGAEKDLIHQRALDNDRELFNLEQIEIEEIENDIALLEEEAKFMSSFSDDKIAFFEIEYGATNTQSFGLKLGYTNDRFADIEVQKTKATKIGRAIDIYYKYNIYNKNNLLLTIRPKVHYSKYSCASHKRHLDMSLLVGYSREGKKESVSFYEIGITGRKYYQQDASNKIGYVISMLEGIKFSDGITFSNYTEYEKAKFTNFIYNRTIYDQVSVAKEFYFDSLRIKSLTCQLGYFWKESLESQIYTISGPILSVWFDL